MLVISDRRLSALEAASSIGQRVCPATARVAAVATAAHRSRGPCTSFDHSAAAAEAATAQCDVTGPTAAATVAAAAT